MNTFSLPTLYFIQPDAMIYNIDTKTGKVYQLEFIVKCNYIKILVQTQINTKLFGCPVACQSPNSWLYFFHSIFESFFKMPIIGGV